MDGIEGLRRKIRATEEELDRLKEELRQAEASAKENGDNQQTNGEPADIPEWKWPLPAEDYERYARQLIISQVGLSGKFTTCSNQERGLVLT